MTWGPNLHPDRIQQTALERMVAYCRLEARDRRRMSCRHPYPPDHTDICRSIPYRLVLNGRYRPFSPIQRRGKLLYGRHPSDKSNHVSQAICNADSLSLCLEGAIAPAYRPDRRAREDFLRLKVSTMRSNPSLEIGYRRVPARKMQVVIRRPSGELVALSKLLFEGLSAPQGLRPVSLHFGSGSLNSMSISSSSSHGVAFYALAQIWSEGVLRARPASSDVSLQKLPRRTSTCNFLSNHY